MILSQTTLPKILLVVGTFMLIIAISTATFLYQSFGFTLTEKLIYGSIGLVFALLGGLFLPVAGILWRLEHPLASALTFLLWIIVLLPIGTQSHLGFMAKSQYDLETAKANNSLDSQLAQLNLTQAQDQLERSRQYVQVDISSLEQRQAQLQDWIVNGDGTQARCCTGYKHYDALHPEWQNTQRINTIIAPWQKELLEIQTQITGYHHYQQALATKRQVLAELKASTSPVLIDEQTDSLAHPLFETQATLVEQSPKLMQASFLAYSAVAYEILTAIVLFLPTLMFGSIPVAPHRIIEAESSLHSECTPASLPQNETTSRPTMTKENNHTLHSEYDPNQESVYQRLRQ